MHYSLTIKFDIQGTKFLSCLDKSRIVSYDIENYKNVWEYIMKNNKKHRINKGLYIVLFFVSIVIICVSMCFSIDSKWFVVLSGVGCGSFASVLVALLVEFFHCKIMNEKDKQILDFALEDLFESVADYCDGYSYFVESLDSKYKSEFHTFYEWVQIYSQLIANGKPPVRKTYIIGAMDSVREAFDLLYNNRVWYLENGIFTTEELHAISKMCKSIYLPRMHYMVADMEVPYQIVLDINTEVYNNMLKVKHFAKLANTKYSPQHTLCEMFVHDEFE